MKKVVLKKIVLKKIVTVGMITAFLLLGGCKLVNADGECTGLCSPVCNVIGGACI